MREERIVIVGAGAVGSALALLLARQERRVLLIEASKSLPTSCTPARIVALAKASVDLLTELGVDVASMAAPIETIWVSDEAGTGQVWLSAHAHGMDAFGAVVDLDRLVACLQQLAAQQEGIEWLRPACVDALRQTGQAVHISAGAHRLRSQLLIGCDGAGGSIARMAGWRFLRGWPHNRFAVVGTLRTSRPAFGLALERFLPDGPLALLPVKDGGYAFVWALAPRQAARLRAANDAAFAAALSAALGTEALARVGEVQSIDARDVVELELLLAPSGVRGRVWLAGAGAHHLHPVAGQGLNLGLRDARTIAEVLSLPPAAEDAGARILGEHYAQRRAPDVALTVGITEGLLSIFGCRAPGAGLVRAAAMRGFSALGTWQKAFVRQLTGLAHGQGEEGDAR